MAELSTPEAITASSCCAPKEQTACCKPGAKTECCDPSHAEGCGCSAGRSAREEAVNDIREPIRERNAADVR